MSRSVRSLATTKAGTLSSRASSRRRSRSASKTGSASAGSFSGVPFARLGRDPPPPRGARELSSSRGRTRRAGRSPFITARPDPVRRTTGFSPGVKSTQPAVTQRRRSWVIQGSEWPRSAPNVWRPVEARALQPRVGKAREELRRRGEPVPPIDAGDGGERLAHQDARLLVAHLLAADLAADVAAAAAGERLRLVAEVAEDRVVAAAAALRPPHEVEEEAPLVLDDLGPGRIGAASHLDQPPAQRQVARRVQEQAEGLLPVAPRAPHLLVVGLDRPRRGEVDDGAHVGAVDAHAEGVRRHHDLERAVRESPLRARAALTGHPRVIAGGAPAPRREPGGLLLRAPAGRRVHDRRPPGGPRAAERLGELRVHLAVPLALGGDVPRPQGEVRAREATEHLRGVGSQPEPDEDLVPDDGSRGRGAGEDPRRAQLGEERADLEVVGAEVVAPLADAVGLVHGDERRREVRDERAEARVGQPLRGDVGQLEGPGAQPRERAGASRRPRASRRGRSRSRRGPRAPGPGRASATRAGR